jgi:hypothetical protein
MTKRILLLWLLALLAGIVIYLSGGRSLAQAAVEGTAPGWFDSLLHIFYPRLAVEKYRFEASFFLRKADQVVLRFALVNFMLLAGVYLYGQKSGFRAYLHHFWNRPVPVGRIPALRVLFFAFLIFFTHEWYRDLTALQRAAAFYKPLPLLRVLHLGFPPSWALAVLCGLLLLSCVTAIFNLKPVLSSAVAAVLFVLLQAFLFSFEKMDHTFALPHLRGYAHAISAGGAPKGPESRPTPAGWLAALADWSGDWHRVSANRPRKTAHWGIRMAVTGNVPQLRVPAPGTAGALGRQVGNSSGAAAVGGSAV